MSASRRCPHHGGVRITEVSAPCRARARRTCCRRRTLSAPAAGRATSRSPTRCSTAPSRAPETSSPTSRPPTPARRVSSGVGTEAPRGQRDMAQQARGQGPGARGQRPGARGQGPGARGQGPEARGQGRGPGGHGSASQVHIGQGPARQGSVAQGTSLGGVDPGASEAVVPGENPEPPARRRHQVLSGSQVQRDGPGGIHGPVNQGGRQEGGPRV